MPYMFKIINAGDGGVGKTTFLKRYTTGNFFEESIETIGTGFFTNSLTYGEKKEKIDLTIWDLGGQKRFRHIIKEFVMGAAGALLFFDLTNFQSFQNLSEWLEIIRTEKDSDTMELPIYLVGSKSDLGDFRAIDQEDIDNFLKENRLIGYSETSAKTGTHINDTMNKLVDAIFKSNKGIY
ncbi:MAG: GTP-binding protein [archaeon]|nr:GTP-binding protein [archaeon]